MTLIGKNVLGFVLMEAAPWQAKKRDFKLASEQKRPMRFGRIAWSIEALAAVNLSEEIHDILKTFISAINFIKLLLRRQERGIWSLAGFEI